MNEETDDGKRMLIGLILLVIGSVLMLVGVGAIPEKLVQPQVPLWVLFLVGVMITFGGIAAFCKPGGAGVTFLAASILFLMGFTFGWIAFFADARGMSGGLPFLSQQVNQMMGKGIFGVVGLFFSGIGVVALRQGFRKLRQ